MVNQPLRIAIVGSSSLVGKELTDVLSDSALGAASFTLLDEEQVAGQVTAAGDEIAFVQRIDSNSFEGMDLVFFAGAPEVTRRHWESARKASAQVIDLTYVLDGAESVHLSAPWLEEETKEDTSIFSGPNPSLKAPIVAGHPAAVALALVTTRLKAKLSVKNLAATILLPASEFGRAAMDELHQQTIRLLSFQSLPTEEYDTQIAFNVISKAGERAKIDLSQTERRILAHYKLLSANSLPEINLQALHTPIFHGYGFSIFVELSESVSVEEFATSLAGKHVDIHVGEADSPSNVAATGKDDLMVNVRSASPVEGKTKSFNLWIAADNLRLAALNAVACGVELQAVRSKSPAQSNDKIM